MGLPSKEGEKPLTPPKPPRNTLPKLKKDISPQDKLVIDSPTQKVKPPLLPKPVVKINVIRNKKNLCNGVVKDLKQTYSGSSPPHNQTELNVKMMDKISTVDEQLTTNQDKLVTQNPSNNVVENVKETPVKPNDGLSNNNKFSSTLKKFECESRTCSKNQSPIPTKCSSKMSKKENNQSALSSPNATESEFNNQILDIKSVREKFEPIESIQSKKSNNDVFEGKQKNYALDSLSIEKKSLDVLGKNQSALSSLNTTKSDCIDEISDLKSMRDKFEMFESIQGKISNNKSVKLKQKSMNSNDKQHSNEIFQTHKQGSDIPLPDSDLFKINNEDRVWCVTSSFHVIPKNLERDVSKIIPVYNQKTLKSNSSEQVRYNETYHSLDKDESNSLAKQTRNVQSSFSSSQSMENIQLNAVSPLLPEKLTQEALSCNIGQKPNQKNLWKQLSDPSFSSSQSMENIQFNAVSPELLKQVTQEALSCNIGQTLNQKNQWKQLSDPFICIKSKRSSSTSSLENEFDSSCDSFEILPETIDNSFKEKLGQVIKRCGESHLKNENIYDIPDSKNENIYDIPALIDTSSDVQFAEEAIYWQTDDLVPKKKVEDSTFNDTIPKQYPSQPTSDTKDVLSKRKSSNLYKNASPVIITDHIYENNFQSKIEDISEDSDDSDVGENLTLQSATPQSPTRSLLTVPGSKNVNSIQEKDKTNRKSISLNENSKVQRSASDQSTKSKQEDVESIGSSSTENSYSFMRKGINSWFSSFGKGEKRLSSFYCDPSLDESFLDQNDLAPHEIENSDSSLPLSSEPSSIPYSIPLSPEEIAEKKKRKSFLVAQEIMTSEKKFIDVLILLSKDMKEQCRSDIPEHEFDSIITPLPQVLLLNEDILKDLEERIQKWDILPKISDIFIKKGPFLKLYASYIQNFQTQCNYFDEYCQKYPIFNQKVRIFEDKYCKKLSVKHNMLKPIQRIPQYRLLLEQYLEQLEPGSVDFADTQKAIQIVCDVAEHADKSMKQGDHLRKLLQIQYQLGSYEIIKPGRVFIKEGELLKQTRRGLQQRFFILLSDCFLYTSYSGPTLTGLRVHYELSLNTMTISVPESDKDYHNEFSIVTTKRSFTLRARSKEERQEWMDALKGAIEAKQQFDMQRLDLTRSLGKVAPLWIPDDNATMCQFCTTKFTTLLRRHHCRACGKVVCALCSDYKAPLQYKTFKPKRVCQPCYNFLLKEFDDPNSNIYDRIKSVFNIADPAQKMELIRSEFKGTEAVGPKKQSSVPPRLIEVSAYDAESQVSGWLLHRSGRNEKSHWYVLKEQVLYRFKAPADVAAEDSIAVLGYNVEILSEKENAYIFALTHRGQTPLIFGLDNEQSFHKWIKALRESTTLR